jgi:hypothetical protein
MSVLRAEAESVHATLDGKARAVYVTATGRVVGPRTGCWSKSASLVGRFNRSVPVADFVDECMHTLAAMRGRK